MAQAVRVIFFCADEAAAPDLRKQITSLKQIRVVAELDEPSLIGHAVAQFPCDAIIADLDRSTEVLLECISQLKQQMPDLPVIALSDNTDGNQVLRAMRAGIKEYLLKPLTPGELDEALKRSLVSKEKEKQPGKLISVMGSAGGVGASMLAVNLAVELAGLVEEGQRVALVDLDFRFGQVGTMLDLHSQFTIADLCATPEQLDPQMIYKAWVKHESGVHVLTRPHNFSQAELISAAHCASVLTSLQQMCEYVVVDGPTRHDPGGRAVLDAADFNLMVIQLLVTSVRNTSRMMHELSSQGFNSDRIQFVCNRVGRESAHLEISHVEETLNRTMLATLPDDWKSVSSSINIGKPIRVEYERTKVRQAINNLAQRIHQPEEAADTESSKGGLLGKLFKKGGKSQGAAPDAAPAPTA